MQHPITIAKPPDSTFRSNSFFDDNWTARGNNFGTQGHWDILTDGDASRGLRVTIERGTHRLADETNGFVVTYIDGAAAAALTSAMRILNLTGTNGTTTLAQMKAVVDAVAGLDSSYFGGETGTGIADMPPGEAGVVSGGTPDGWMWVQVASGETGTSVALIAISAATPNTNNSTGYYVRPRAVDVGRLVGPGQQLWTRRLGGSDLDGSVHRWLMDEGQYRSFSGGGV